MSATDIVALRLALCPAGFTPLPLLGQADIYVGEMLLTIHGVLVLKWNGRVWASLPSPAMLDKDGVALRDDRGKVKYEGEAA